MTGPVAYPYAEGRLLDTPAQYSYSRYQGEPFLHAWRAQRAAMARDLAGAAPASAAPGTPVQALLEHLAREIEAPQPSAACLSTLQRLLQRFEVTKRLHAHYNDHWRPLDPAEFRGAERYVLFAEVLERAYAATGQLPFLNGLLKCMDTVSSLAAQLDGRQAARVRALVEREDAHVRRLASRCGLALPEDRA